VNRNTKFDFPTKSGDEEEDILYRLEDIDIGKE
jgi:hypothetical protein